MAICYPLSAGNWLQNEWPWMTLNGYLTSKSVFSQHSVAEQMRLLEPTAQIWMKIDPYYQRQKCRPMTLVSGKIRFIKHSSNIPLGGVVKRYWGLSTTAIFGDLGGYVFENFRDTASNIIWQYATLVGNWLQNEWPCMTLSGYLMSKSIFGQHSVAE